MKAVSIAVVVGALTAFAEQVVQYPAASVGGQRGGLDADRAAIARIHQQDIAATLSRDVASPGDELKQARGTALVVLKKLPDGSWKAFRGMGIPE